MERMKVKYVIDGKDYITLPAYEILEEKYNQLEEENKKLKEEIKSRQEEVERFKTNAMQDMAEITELENQIKKLKSEKQPPRFSDFGGYDE